MKARNRICLTAAFCLSLILGSAGRAAETQPETQPETQTEMQTEAQAAETVIASVISCSSQLGGEYGTGNLQDYNVASAWVEGEPGNGEGSWLEYTFPAGTLLCGFEIFPGYQKSENLFWSNASPAVLEVAIDDVSQTFDLTETAGSFGLAAAGQRFWFDQPVACQGAARVIIKSVRAGNAYTDTCISELRFLEAGTRPGSSDPEKGEIQDEPASEENGAQPDDTDTTSAGQPEGAEGAGPTEGTKSAGQPEGAEGAGPTEGTKSAGQPDSAESAGRPESAESAGQPENAEGSTQADSTEETAEEMQWKLERCAAMAGWLYKARNGYGDVLPADLYLAQATPQEKAFLLYYYQYNYEDSRISGTGEYHIAAKSGLLQILDELFGPGNEEALACFAQDYSVFGDQDPLTMYATGDFGDAGSYFFGQPSAVTWSEDGRLLVRGDVLIWSEEDGNYQPGLEYSVYITEEENTEAGRYRLSEVVVE